MVCDYHRARWRGRDAQCPIRRCQLAGVRLRPRSRAGRASPTRPRCSRASRWPSRRKSGSSVERRYGAALIAERFRSFDTICSATQERQDAVLALLDGPLDVMVVVGGYNSSNTCHLAALVQSRGIRTYHIEDADCLDRSTPGRFGISRSGRSERSGSRGGFLPPGPWASPPAPRRPTTRSARPSSGSARSPAWPASSARSPAEGPCRSST